MTVEQPKASVLVVEDENIVAMDIASTLHKLRYSVVGVAAGGDEAIEQAKRVRPDLVLMDIRLRGEMDGITAAQEIRRTLPVPIVYLTAYSDASTLDRARNSHPFGYLVKPFGDRDLDVAIQIALHRHETESALRRSEARSRSILDAAQDAIVVADGEGAITDWNGAAQATFGYPKPRALNRPLSLLLSPAHRGEMERLLAQHAERDDRTLPGTRYELQGMRRNGEVFPVELSLSRWEDEGAPNFTCIIRDITERKRTQYILEQELQIRTHDLEELAHEVTRRKRELQTALESMRVARDHAERTSRLKSTFLGMVSHELRSPLGALQLQIERLRVQMESESVPSFGSLVRRMASSCGRLTVLVESLLEYARIEGGRLTVEVEAFDVTSVASEVIEELREQAAEKGLELVLDPAGGSAGLRVASDPKLVRLILVNLLGNAIKFTDQGRVVLSIESGSDGHRLSVRDTGPGIPPEQRTRVFEPFEQLERWESKHRAGVGLGLALVREMVSSLSGYVELESEVGAGSTFTVVLPDQKKKTHGEA